MSDGFLPLVKAVVPPPTPELPLPVARPLGSVGGEKKVGSSSHASASISGVVRSGSESEWRRV